MLPLFCLRVWLWKCCCVAWQSISVWDLREANLSIDQLLRLFYWLDVQLSYWTSSDESRRQNPHQSPSNRSLIITIGIFAKYLSEGIFKPVPLRFIQIWAREGILLDKLQVLNCYKEFRLVNKYTRNKENRNSKGIIENKWQPYENCLTLHFANVKICANVAVPQTILCHQLKPAFLWPARATNEVSWRRGSRGNSQTSEGG